MGPRGERQGVLLTVAYDGARYAGFAPQPGQRTVAGELLRALREVDSGIASLRGASRTDAGVHARAQRVAFDTGAQLPSRGWALAPARYLPSTISIAAAAFVREGFDPRFQATSKTYRYLLLDQPTADPHLAGRAWRVRGIATEPAVATLERELAAAGGTHDFAAFRSAQDTRENTERTISATSVCRSPERPELLRLEVTGDGFLHRMVRILVGTAVDVAREQLAPGAIMRALSSGDRSDAGITAPPDGLYLQRIQLSTEGEDRWPPV